MLPVLRRSPLPAILLGALLLRVVAAIGLQHELDDKLKRPFLIMGDAEGYWELGECIAHGKSYQLYEPPRRVLRMPGYPIFVAASIRLSEALGISRWDHFFARLLLAGVGTLACGLVAVIGRELFGPRIGMMAAAITAIAPSLIGFSVLLLSETLFATAALVSLWCMVRLVAAHSRGAGRGRLFSWAAWVGIAIGVAVYVRPSWLLFAPLFGMLLVVSLAKRRQLWEGAALAAVVVVCTYATLLPWAYRNFQVTGHWVFTTLWVGPSLYDGFNPQATGDSNMEFFERDRPMDRMSEYEVDRYYRDQAWTFIRENPRRAIALVAGNLVRFWMPWPNAKQFGGLGPRIAVAAFFIPVLLAAVYGWLTGPRNFWGWAISLGPILYFSAIHAVFLGSLRYRLPVEYPLCIASAVGLEQLMRRFVARTTTAS